MKLSRSVRATRTSRPSTWKLPPRRALRGSMMLLRNSSRASVSERGSLLRIGLLIGPTKPGKQRSLRGGRGGPQASPSQGQGAPLPTSSGQGDGGAPQRSRGGGGGGSAGKPTGADGAVRTRAAGA